MEKENTEKKTFKERYYEEKAKPTPAMTFVLRCMKATKSSKNTVRCWICGTRVPDALAREALANEFGCTPEELFPLSKEGGLQ